MAGRGIRVEPPFLEFKDIKVGEVYRKEVTLTNIGKVSRKVSVEKPKLKLFKLTGLSKDGFVPPGFFVRGKLEFTPDTDEEVRDSIKIHIDEQEILQIPVTGFPKTCCLIMDSLLDFGCIVASSQVVSKLHPIINKGSAPGVFQVEYSGGNSSLSFLPSNGVIVAGTTQWLKVELRTDRPGEIHEKALVKLQDYSTVVLSIKAEVVEQQLEVSDLQGSPLSCLWFGPVYFGASCVQTVLLRNKSPIYCDWVSLLLNKTAGTEVGTDFQKSTRTVLLERMKNCSSPCLCHDVFQFLQCVPAHGRLGAYETTTVAVRFSPLCRRKWRNYLPGRQDYCLFLLFDIVGRKHGFTHPKANSSVELAVTGSGVPVALVPSPSDTFDFPTCAMGQYSDLLCVLQNLCPQLPVRFRFRKLSHFNANPTTGTIAPGQCQDVVLTFNAWQQGNFQVRQKVDVLGWVVSQKDGSSSEVRCFHTISLHLSATCHSVMTHHQPKLRPALKCPTGLRAHVRLSELAHCSMLARVATSQLHKYRKQRSEDTEGEEFLAFPNDRAGSIRPASPHRQYRTIFTGIPRYHYVDTSYAYTEKEEEERQHHRQIYMDFIKQLRQERLEKIQKRQQHTGSDNALETASSQGLVPPVLCIRDLDNTKNFEVKPDYSTNSITSQISEAINVVPSTRQQVADCSRTLTPVELYQVDISPLLVDFGSVCLESVCVQKLNLINRLPVHVWVELEVDCPELQGSSPLSQVLPPYSHSSLPLTFQSSQFGPFCRSLNYTVNQKHPGQILIQAQVVPLALELSTNLLVLPPHPTMRAGSEYRSSVTLRNLCNCVVEFTWKPVIPKSGLLLFSVRPATGTVEPHMELDCEVVWHPSFSSPSEGDFDLCVHEGNTQRLRCVAKIGPTTVQLTEKRILFRSMPLNTTFIRTAVLHNSGQNHAYYQVVDICPLPGMVLSPSEGVVPSRGQAMITIQFNPDCFFKFDAKVEIALRNMKSIELIVAGSVEPPNVDFSMSRIQFWGVYAGSQQLIPFSITNHSPAMSQVTFDLSRYKDFSVEVCQPSAKTERGPGVTVVEISSGQTKECYLVFSPTQVSSYDFFLPLTVNGVKSATSLSTSISSSCTALLLTPESRKNTIVLKAECEQSVCWQTVAREGVHWWFDLSAAKRGTKELCVVTPTCGFLRPGQSVCVGVTVNPETIRIGEKVTKLSIPLYLGEKKNEGKQRNEGHQPYRKLSVIIVLRLPSVTFHPSQILFPPVPLRKSIQETRVISLLCEVSFCSVVPVSLCTTITFSDHMYTRFKIRLYAVAVNCLLTVWPYVVLHRSNQQIILKTGAKAVEAILHSYQTPSAASGPISSSSSSLSFDHSSLTYNSGHKLLRVVFAIETSDSSGRAYGVSQNKDTRSVVDMLRHLTGRQIPGIPLCQTFSKDVHERTAQLLQQHEAMLAFLKVQGAYLCHIKPEYLLDVLEFRHWCSLQQEDTKNGLDLNSVDYESLSKRSWTDVLLQIYKVLVLSRVAEEGLNTPLNCKDTDETILDGSQPLTSNIYSPQELHLLSWLNMNYQKMRKTAWDTDRVPSSRWIVNFDLDFTDGLVLAAVTAAYCPYLIRSHFRRMYTTPRNLEQILHNNIIVTRALTLLGLSINVKSTDLCDANPVQILFLCVHLYETLPHYLPSQTLTLTGGLHSTFSKQVLLKNPSSRPLRYKVILVGEDAHLFSLPSGSTVTIPSKSSTELTVQFTFYFLRPVEAVLLITSNTFGLCRATLAFSLKTCVNQITATHAIQWSSPCYQLKVIKVPLTNKFNKKANFRVVLVESSFNPLEPEKGKDLLAQQGFSNPSKKNMNSYMTGGDELEDGEANEFLSTERSVYLNPGQTHNLSILYLPFFTRTKYCSVLLLSPQVGDMVYVMKATSEIPLLCPLPPRPSLIPGNSDSDGCVLSFQCKVGEVCEEVAHVPLVNMFLEEALAVWAHHCMSAGERRRRILTRSLHSSTVRAATSMQKLLKQPLMKSIYFNEEIKYKVEVSLPQYFSLPKTVIIPVKEGTHVRWETSADCGCVDIPLHFQAHSVGQFTCNMVLTSYFDVRVYQLRAFVTQQEEVSHLDFSSPALQSVTQHIPLLNETHHNWSVQARVCGEGFSGPDVVNVPAGTKESYPLTFYPASQCIVTGKLCLHNDWDGKEHVFTLRGVGEPPLPVDHIILSCPVGRTTYAQLNVPNHTQTKLTLRAVTDLPIVSGSLSLEINPGQTSPYTLALSPWKRGEHTGSVSFIEISDMEENESKKGNEIGKYIVIFSLLINCEPGAPVKVIDVQCVAKNSVAIEIPVSNPGEELLTLDVCLEGGDLMGDDWISLPPQGTQSYKVTYSPVRVGKGIGSVVFQSELMGEFWYQLELYALPPSVITLPQARCHLGKWLKMNIPLVNPTAETLELIVTNTNPRNYTLEMDSADTLMLVPQSFTNLGVRFSPSSIGEENHHSKITFTCSQLQDCCVLLSGCGLIPEIEEPLCMSCLIGSSTSIAVPFINPTDHQVTLSITLTTEHPSKASNCKPVTDEKTLSCPLDHAEALQISERATIDVPVVFTPKSMELQKAWLCITMKPISGQDNSIAFSTDSTRSREELLHISWIYPLHCIPLEALSENSPHVVLQCEEGCQLERTVDVQLTGYVPGNEELKGQEVLMEDFLCKVHSDSEVESSELSDCLSTSIKAARRDPESGIIMLTLLLIYTPQRICRSSSILVVQTLSGKIWEFPFTLIATKPQVDDVVNIETTELGRTSAVGFRLTSTTRSLTSFKATFLPGSSTEFTVTPASGMLPPAGTAGALITVSFTPTASCKRHRARLAVQAADMQWIYDVRGKTPQDSPLLRKSSTKDSFPAPRPSRDHQRNFVVHNLRIPALANSSPVKVKK
ncbi:LOW QUALITY PROTEIN: cilia- and flagella-associated protein 47-like [Anableps anableps]